MHCLRDLLRNYDIGPKMIFEKIHPHIFTHHLLEVTVDEHVERLLGRKVCQVDVTDQYGQLRFSIHKLDRGLNAKEKLSELFDRGGHRCGLLLRRFLC
jgi:hypothetical protein